MHFDCVLNVVDGRAKGIWRITTTKIKILSRDFSQLFWLICHYFPFTKDAEKFYARVSYREILLCVCQLTQAFRFVDSNNRPFFYCMSHDNYWSAWCEQMLNRIWLIPCKAKLYKECASDINDPLSRKYLVS